jgi:hypothetical protein
MLRKYDSTQILRLKEQGHSTASALDVMKNNWNNGIQGGTIFTRGE